MNIEGLDYNTQRERLVLPEYGREIQEMVNYAVALPTKNERQACAEAIIDTMKRLFMQGYDNADFEQKLWDHLAIMSQFQLDIDYPYDVSNASHIAIKPGRMDYSGAHIPVRHYGKILFDIFEKLKTMKPGEERDALVGFAANQMKRSLAQWGHGSSDDERVASDLATFTDGRIQLDLDRFQFEHTQLREFEKRRKKR
jgi:hypothetical protein